MTCPTCGRDLERDNRLVAYSGERLRAAIHAQGWSTRQVAQRVGYSQQTLHMMARGQKRTRMWRLEAVANAVEVPVESLLNGA